VVYQNGYRDTSGIDFLVKAGIEVSQIEELWEIIKNRRKNET
jgi:dCMP deaminase